MTLFADAGGGRRRKQSSSLKAKTNQAKRDATAAADATVRATAPVTTGPLALSASAQRVYDEIDREWELSPAVRVLLRIACEAITKSEAAEAIVAAEGMTVGDQKGSRKPHPAAVLAHNSRTLAATTLQRVLSSLGG